jgi:hypothetical protein
MYIQITEKCGMHCAHCCMDSGPGGKHMSKKTYVKTLELCGGDYTSLGGGEPTMHPLFWEFLGLALGSDVEGLWMATNGSQTKIALALAKMAKSGVLGVALSRDDYHDEIDPSVVRAFEKDKGRNYNGAQEDLREIRTVTDIKASGRAKNWGNDGCCCDDIVVDIHGDIWACGCKTMRFGTVWKPDYEAIQKWQSDHPNECWEKVKTKEEEKTEDEKEI